MVVYYSFLFINSFQEFTANSIKNKRLNKINVPVPGGPKMINGGNGK